MTNSTVLITGANRGIGLELTRQFSEGGWQVLACCRSPQNAEDLNRIATDNPAIEVYPLDVTDYEQLSGLSLQLKNKKIDILLSNAGIYGSRTMGVFGQVEVDAWRQVLEINTIAPLMLAQAFVDQVAASEQKLIAIISSRVGSIEDNSSGGSYIYRSSKTAVNQVVKSLSIDLAGRGISTLSLHPGWVKTDMGGSEADIMPTESVAGLKQILIGAGLPENGMFFDYDGSVIPW
ncbi:MAG: SDR family oxidoreductase [Gammaproteobacteria bacterium]|nr:SDR family oxidoreductase [Gammaproteobacteria bacterium]